MIEIESVLNELLYKAVMGNREAQKAIENMKWIDNCSPSMEDNLENYENKHGI